MIELIQKRIALSSRVIAEETGKQHQHVKRDIKKQLFDLNIDESIFGHKYLDYYKREQHEYCLDYEQTMILISGYSTPLRAKIIKRWNALEKQNTPQLPQSFSEALQLAADQAKQLELQAPKVELADKCIRLETQMSITDAGKHLGLRQKDIFEIMRCNYYLTKRNLPTQKALDRKILTLKTNSEEGFKQAVMTMNNIMNFQERHCE